MRTIAQHLNTERVPYPRRKGWSSSALQAMLQNPIYQGTYLWNRSEWIKEHETRRRRRFERPESEWLRREMPELAIVSPELWARVELLRMERTTGYPSAARTAVSPGEPAPATKWSPGTCSQACLSAPSVAAPSSRSGGNRVTAAAGAVTEARRSVEMASGRLPGLGTRGSSTPSPPPAPLCGAGPGGLSGSRAAPPGITNAPAA